MAELQDSLLSKSNRAIVEHCLGLSKIADLGPLADKILVVCLDTESWTGDNHKMTEIGIATFDMRDMRAQIDTSGQYAPGTHGEYLLKQVYFYHARIAENAHLVNIKFYVGDPEL
jgi:hypothetical protein